MRSQAGANCKLSKSLALLTVINHLSVSPHVHTSQCFSNMRQNTVCLACVLAPMVYLCDTDSPLQAKSAQFNNNVLISDIFSNLIVTVTEKIGYSYREWYGAGLAIARSRVRIPPTAAVYQRQLSVPSLRGLLISTSGSWGVNGHTT